MKKILLTTAFIAAIVLTSAATCKDPTGATPKPTPTNDCRRGGPCNRVNLIDVPTPTGTIKGDGTDIGGMVIVIGSACYIVGATAKTNNGVKLTCKSAPNDKVNRWRAS